MRVLKDITLILFSYDCKNVPLRRHVVDSLERLLTYICTQETSRSVISCIKKSYQTCNSSSSESPTMNMPSLEFLKLLKKKLIHEVCINLRHSEDQLSSQYGL